MRSLLSSTLAVLLLLAPLLPVFGQAGSSCAGVAAGVSFLENAAAAAGCCAREVTSSPSLSPACAGGHQCCAPDAPVPDRTLAVVENRTLPSPEFKATAAGGQANQFARNAGVLRPAAPVVHRLPTTNALRCSLIQRWRI